MVTAIPNQLEDVLSDLADQETAISSQLAGIQAKLAAVREVIQLFNGSTEAPAKTSSRPKAKAPARTKKKTTKTAAKAKTIKQSKTTKTAAKAKTIKQSKTAKTSTRKKKDGRAASWQKYALPGVSKKPMPESVKLILETQPDKEFKIADVMSALFKEDMPKSQYLKARNRISNILSGGVRNGEWFKGDRGTYRLTAGK